MKQVFIIMFLVLFASMLCADWWTSTDWSDSTSLDSIINLNGTREPGNLILDAPDVWNWEYMASLHGAQNVYDLLRTTDGTIFAATGNSNGDVFKSTDNGISWDTTGNLYLATTIFDLFLFKNSILYAGGVRGNGYGVVFFSANAGSTWNYGDILPRNVYSIGGCGSNLFAGKGITGAEIYISYDNGQTWEFKQGFPTDVNFLTFLPVDSSTIIGGTGSSKGYIVRSTNSGELWQKMDSLNTSVDDIEKDISNILFCCTSNGKVFKSTNLGLDWDTTGTLNAAQELNKLLYADNSVLYSAGRATGNIGAVYRSFDLGNNWERVADVVNGHSILSLEETQNGFLFVGTNIDASIYRAGYFRDGYLISKPFYTGTTNGSTKYGIIQWSDLLNGGLLNVKVRSDTNPSMSSAPPWHFVRPVSNGDSIVKNLAVNDGEGYIQYYVELKTQDPAVSPELKRISIEYSVDTVGPIPDSAVAYDGFIQQNGIDDDDYVVIFFNEPTNKQPIPNAEIDSLLKLNSGSWGIVDTVYWNCEGGPGSGSATSLTVELNTNSTISVGVKITPDTVIKDIWNNDVSGMVKLMGTFDDEIPPTIMSAFASDNIDSIQGIDRDDFVRLIFDQATNAPQIDSSNISSVLRLSNGHTWGVIDSTHWTISTETLVVFLDTSGTPTIEVGDTIYPDSSTIRDINNNPCISPRVITGTFGDYGPVIVSAVAYEGIIQKNGIDSDDYVNLYFNEVTNHPQIDSENIESVFKLNNNHLWNPIFITQWNGSYTILRVFFNPNGNDTPSVWQGDTIYPDSITITDSLGQPCIHPVVLTGSFNPGVEEYKNRETVLPVKLGLNIRPNPSRNIVNILYDIPVKQSFSESNKTKIEIFDVTGRKIETIVNKAQLPGRYSLTLENKGIKQGIYFIKITSSQKSLTSKLILLQ